MEFDYLKREWSRGFVYVPTLPISLNGFPVGHALVDTGADATLLPMELNQVLGVDLDTKNALKFIGASGDSFLAIPATQKIEYCIEKAGFRPVRWKGTVFFVKGQPTILLGQYQCLSELSLTLDAKRKKIQLNNTKNQ